MDLSWRVRPAEMADESAVLGMYQDAKRALAEAGVDQWQTLGPDRTTFKNDVASGQSYLLEVDLGDGFEAAGTMFLSFLGEASYLEIEGAWADDGPYGVMHRVALAARFRGMGLAPALFAFALAKARDLGFGHIRIDTHEDNLVMQRQLERNGFSKRGVIWLDQEKRDPSRRRWAYEVDCKSLEQALGSWPMRRNLWQN